MYVSRAVAAIRDDPVPGESITLVLETAADADPEGVADAVRDSGGSVDRRLQFDDLAATVPQERVGEIQSIDGLTAVQTADAIGIHPDEAEEDVDPGA